MDLRTLVATDALDAELAALIWQLAESGLPLVVVANEREAAEEIRRAFAEQVRMAQPTRDALAGGVFIGNSLEDVLRMLGGGSEISDDARDLGVVLVMRERRVTVAHYVRPVERDGAGHLQRRPPAVLSARDASSGLLDHFYWAFTEELASRTGMARTEFEDAHEMRTRQLAGADPGPGVSNAPN